MARKGRIRKRETSSCCEPALFFDETSPWVKPAQGGGRGEEGGKRDRHKVGLLVGRRVSSRSLTGRRGQEGVFFTPLLCRETQVARPWYTSVEDEQGLGKKHERRREAALVRGAQCEASTGRESSGGGRRKSLTTAARRGS